MVSAWKNSDEEDEVSVPESMLFALWFSRTMGVIPARLRRARAGWQLSVSSPLVKLQRIIVVITSILVLSVVVMRTIMPDATLKTCARIGGKCFANVLKGAELALIVLTYVLGTWKGLDKLQAVKALIQKTQKINSSFNYYKSKSKRASNKMFIVYVVWQVLTIVEDLIYNARRIPSSKENVLAMVTVYFSVAIFYQAVMGPIIRMMICAMILELKFTLTLINDKLEDLLLTPPKPFKDIKLYLRELIPQRAKISGYTKDATPLEKDVRGIRHINRCHDMICDMVVQIDKLCGPILLLFFMLLSLQLMINPQILLADLRASRVNTAIRQTNRILMLITDLLVLVEPCQRLQGQMDRTRRLLGRLVGQAQLCGVDPAQLDLFILQAQMRDVALAPMGVITVGRPLVGSIIGGVVTYLIIVIQFQTASD